MPNSVSSPNHDNEKKSPFVLPVAQSGLTVGVVDPLMLVNVRIRLGQFLFGLKIGVSLHSKPASTTAPLCMCVCVSVLAVAPQPLSERENKTTSQPLHRQKGWFGLDCNVPCLSDPESVDRSYYDVSASVYRNWLSGLPLNYCF